MKKLVIIKVGSTFPSIVDKWGDFEDWIITGCGLPASSVWVINALSGDKLPTLEKVSGVIVSGSQSMVTDNQPWVIKLAEWIVQVVGQEVPFLGICFGHQLLVQALGGKVGYHPQGAEIGTVAIDLAPAANDDKLIGGLPAKFSAHTTHAQSVLAMPKNSICLAGNAFETHHAIRIGACAWGVQFHPEFSAAVMQAYIVQQTEKLQAAGKDISGLLSSVCDTEIAGLILPRFVALIS